MQLGNSDRLLHRRYTVIRFGQVGPIRSVQRTGKNQVISSAEKWRHASPSQIDWPCMEAASSGSGHCFLQSTKARRIQDHGDWDNGQRGAAAVHRMWCSGPGQPEMLLVQCILHDTVAGTHSTSRNRMANVAEPQCRLLLHKSSHTGLVRHDKKRGKPGKWSVVYKRGFW